MVNAKNDDVRQAIKQAGLRYWQVAMEMGISDGNFSRKLRAELPAAEKKKIFEAINRLTKEAG